MDYVSIDSDGNEVTPRNRSMNDMARQPKTQLQREALEATKTPKLQFEGRDQHERFRKFEENLIAGDANAKLWKAWIVFCINNAKGFNRIVRNVNMDKLLAHIGNKEKRTAWIDEHRKDILKKANLVPVGVTKGRNIPQPVVKKTAATPVEALIAKLENALNVNIINNQTNKEYAQKILDDGRDVDTWIAWATSEEHKKYCPQYKNVTKIWGDWPQAFAEEKKAVEW